MKKTVLVCALFFSAAMTGSALAATVTGRITYIDPKARQVMIDNSTLYDLAPAVDIASLNVADAVRLDVTSERGRPVITAVRK